MKFLKKTERYYYGMLEPGEKAPEGIQARTDPDNGETRVRFPCSAVSGWDDCLRQVKSGEGQSRTRKTVRVHTKSLVISDGDWEAMQKYMVDPARFKREDFRVYEAWLCHNVVDRDDERFSLDVLRAFEASIPGKAVLTGHDWNGTGEGRFFRARLEKTDTVGMLNMTGQSGDTGADESMKRIESTDGGLFWLVAGYYLLADDEEKIRKIDSGIVSDMSIGFRAPELAPVKSDTGDILWWEYRNSGTRRAEALEGSHVFLGAQYGARTRKDAGREPGAGPDHGESTDTVQETLKLACLCGVVPFDEAAVEAARKELSGLTVDALQERQQQYREKLDARRGTNGILAQDTTVREQPGFKMDTRPDARHFRAPTGLKLTTKQGGIQ